MNDIDRSGLTISKALDILMKIEDEKVDYIPTSLILTLNRPPKP
jgi:hypothetical protein